MPVFLVCVAPHPAMLLWVQEVLLKQGNPLSLKATFQGTQTMAQEQIKEWEQIGGAKCANR